MSLRVIPSIKSRMMPRLHQKINLKTRHSQYRVSRLIKRVLLNSRQAINNPVSNLVSSSLHLKLQNLMIPRQFQHRHHLSNQNLKIKVKIPNPHHLHNQIKVRQPISNSSLLRILLLRLHLQRLVIKHRLSHCIHHELLPSNPLIQPKTHRPLPTKLDRNRLQHQFQRRKRNQLLQKMLNLVPKVELLSPAPLLPHLQQFREKC